jgi:hypothetical protein
MDIPRDDNSSKRTIDWNKSKEQKLTHLAEFAVRRRPIAIGMEEIMHKPEPEKEATPTEELPSLTRTYTRGQMIDLLMEFPQMTAKYKHYIVKYNPSGHFYSVNEYFDFSVCNKNEEWTIWEH